MKTKIVWKDKPRYDHAGRWHKTEKSIMNPGAMVTWPQFIVEMIVYNRSTYLKTYPKIQKGDGWSNAISTQVKSLCQQAYNICNYFPHPDDEPLVKIAFKNVFRDNRVMKIGGFRKNRISKDGKCLISQDEKNVVTEVYTRLEYEIGKRSCMTKQIEIVNNAIETSQNVLKPTISQNDITDISKKNSLSRFLQIEKDLKNG